MGQSVVIKIKTVARFFVSLKKETVFPFIFFAETIFGSPANRLEMKITIPNNFVTIQVPKS